MSKNNNTNETGLFDPSKEELKRLLLPTTIIRDPVHGDVLVTDLERTIIDSPLFQRLRGMKQLGLSYLVYPGAEHTRFLHSLGVLHVCAWMTSRCNETANTYSSSVKASDPLPLGMGDYQTLLARLVALVHDCAHIPFGHSLEREGRYLAKDEWQDPDRFKKVFEDKGGLTSTIRGFLDERFSEVWIKQLINDLKETLLAESREQIDALSYPCVHDLVANTMCADLLDYVERDAFFCGLGEKFGKRFLTYMSVIPVATVKNVGKDQTPNYRVLSKTDCEKLKVTEVFANRASDKAGERIFCKVVLLGYRYNEKGMTSHKRSVITEAIDLVRRRFNVAEKVYYHHTKIKATSMLGQAFGSSNLKMEDIWLLPDAGVLRELANPTRVGALDAPSTSGRLTNSDRRQRRSVELAKKLERRHLFTPVYVAKYHPKDSTVASKLLWHPSKGAFARFSDPHQREALVDKLETILGLRMADDVDDAIGSVTIYCPAENMNRKEFNMLVLPEPDSPLGRLEDSAHPLDKAEIAAIKESHLNLWRIEVCVDPDVLKRCDARPGRFASVDTQYLLAGVIEEAIGPKNELQNPTGTINTEALIQELTIDAVATKYKIDLLDRDRQEALLLDYRGFTQEQREKGLLEVFQTKGYPIDK